LGDDVNEDRFTQDTGGVAGLVPATKNFQGLSKNNRAAGTSPATTLRDGKCFQALGIDWG